MKERSKKVSEQLRLGGEVSKEKHRLLAEYEYLLNFFVVQLVHTSTVGQYDQ